VTRSGGVRPGPTAVVFFVLGALGLAGCASLPRTSHGATASRSGFVFERWHDGASDLPYAVYVPRGYDSSQPLPLILFLHGSGESGRDGSKMIVQGLGSAILWDAARWPAIVIFPQKPGEDEEWEEHEAALMGILARVRATYSVDPRRIYLTGLSQGGHGTWVLGARHADMWAALVPVCGYAGTRRHGPRAFDGTAADLAPALKSMPIWAFHGEVDDVVPPQETRDFVAAVQAAGGTPKMSILPGVNHGAWDPAYRDPELAAWLFAQHR